MKRLASEFGKLKILEVRPFQVTSWMDVAIHQLEWNMKGSC